MSDVIPTIERGQLVPVYLLFGNEPAPMHDIVAALRKAVLVPGMEAFNHERFSGRELEAAGVVLDACGQLPMMAPRRLVELSDPEAIGKGRGGKDELDPLLAYVAKPNPTTILVITSAGIDGRSRLVTAVKKTGTVVKLEALKRDADAVQWMIDHAKRRGIGLPRAVANALVERVGTGQSELQAALERAALHAGTTAPVSLADVDAVVTHTREAVIFDLTDAVGMGDGKKALAILSHMFHETPGTATGQANAAIAMLVRQIRLVFTTKMAGTQATGVPPFVARKLDAQARCWSEPRLCAALAGLARLDRDLKGGSAAVARAPYVALQRWILDVCAALPDTAPRV